MGITAALGTVYRTRACRRIRVMGITIPVVSLHDADVSTEYLTHTVVAVALVLMCHGTN